ncbi:unnamed protein product [Boreogadus saida]
MATASKKHADFVSEPMGRMRSEALPGIGPILGRRLAYMVLGRDEVRFNRWLHDACGANEEQQRDCHRAIQEWSNNNV